jgi:hypothetical protein
MDSYVVENTKGTTIIGTITGPGTWCYIKKNEKKGKVRQVYPGAIFKFDNIGYQDVKAYEITGRFKGIQRSLVSDEVYSLPKVVKSENSDIIKLKDEITLLNSKIHELTIRCDKLEATLVRQSSLQPNTPSQNPRKRNRQKSQRHICAFEPPEFVLTEIVSYCIRPTRLTHVLFNCVDVTHVSVPANIKLFQHFKDIKEVQDILVDNDFRKLLDNIKSEYDAFTPRQREKTTYNMFGTMVRHLKDNYPEDFSVCDVLFKHISRCRLPLDRFVELFNLYRNHYIANIESMSIDEIFTTFFDKRIGLKI